MNLISKLLLYYEETSKSKPYLYMKDKTLLVVVVIMTFVKASYLKKN